MIKHPKSLLPVLVLFLLTACAPTSPIVSQVTEIAPTSVYPPASRPSPTVSIPEDTPIASTPTDTPITPTSTKTPTPASLNGDGPYVMFFGHGGIWITNPDGSFAKKLLDYDLTAALDMHRLISPTGDRMALVISNEQGLDLVIIKIPGGEQETVAHLIDAQPAGYHDPTSAQAFATYAIRDFDSIAWQPPDGRLLAFIGAMNGPTADLYLYDTVSKEITQLTDGPSQAILPIWSPDGQYILQYGVRWTPPFGGAIVGPNQIDGIWAVRASDGEVITLPKPQGSVPHFVGWQNESHYITYDPGDCYSENLRSISVPGGEATLIMENSFWYNISISPENGGLLFSSKEECTSSLGEGVFLLLPGEAAATRLIEKRAWEIDWIEESKLFFAYPEALITSDGEKSYLPPVYEASFDPAVSIKGYQAWNVIQNQQSTVMVRVGDGDWQAIMTGSVDELIWDPVFGETLLIAVNGGDLYAASYPDFSPSKVESLGGSVNAALWVP